MHSLREKKKGKGREKGKEKYQHHLVLKSLPLHYTYHNWPAGACPVHSHKDERTEAAATGGERTRIREDQIGRDRESEEDLISVYKYWRGRENKYALSG